jgi:hypothetical protein
VTRWCRTVSIQQCFIISRPSPRLSVSLCIAERSYAEKPEPGEARHVNASLTFKKQGLIVRLQVVVLQFGKQGPCARDSPEYSRTDLAPAEGVMACWLSVRLRVSDRCFLPGGAVQKPIFLGRCNAAGIAVFDRALSSTIGLPGITGPSL